MAMRDLEKFIQGLEDRVPVFTAPDSSAQTNRTEAKDDLGQLTSAPLPNQYPVNNQTAVLTDPSPVATNDTESLPAFKPDKTQ